jgi:hypothetical protein
VDFAPNALIFLYLPAFRRRVKIPGPLLVNSRFRAESSRIPAPWAVDRDAEECVAKATPVALPEGRCGAIDQDFFRAEEGEIIAARAVRASRRIPG